MIAAISQPVILPVLSPASIPITIIIELTAPEIVTAIAISLITIAEIIVETLIVVESTIAVKATVVIEPAIAILVKTPVLPEISPEILTIVLAILPEVLSAVLAIAAEILPIITAFELRLWCCDYAVLQRITVGTPILAKVLSVVSAIAAEVLAVVLAFPPKLIRILLKGAAILAEVALRLLQLRLHWSRHRCGNRGLKLGLPFLPPLKALLRRSWVHRALRLTLLAKRTTVELGCTVADLPLAAALAAIILCHGGAGNQRGCCQQGHQKRFTHKSLR